MSFGKRVCLSGVLLLVCAAQAHAAGESPPKAAQGDGLVQAAAPVDPFGSAVAAAQLGATRAAGAGPSTTTIYGAVTDSNLSAVNSGNAINAASVNTGAVTLQSGAFSGFSGLGNFVINSGNNNNLQGSLNLTVVMAPGRS